MLFRSEIMDETGKAVQRAKINLLLKASFFGNLLMHLPIEPDANIPTFGTNGEHIKYCPSYAKTLTRDETSGVLAHEVMHCVFEHHLRRGTKNHKVYNEAGDYCINPILIESGFTLPRGALLNRRFYNMTTDQIYNILMAEKQAKQQNKPESGENKGEGEGEG